MKPPPKHPLVPGFVNSPALATLDAAPDQVVCLAEEQRSVRVEIQVLQGLTGDLVAMSASSRVFSREPLGHGIQPLHESLAVERSMFGGDGKGASMRPQSQVAARSGPSSASALTVRGTADVCDPL